MRYVQSRPEIATTSSSTVHGFLRLPFCMRVSFIRLVEATYVQHASEDVVAALRSREQKKIPSTLE